MDNTEQTQGIILRTIRYGETSLIVHWLTEDQGRIATMARGVQRRKSEFRGKLDLFHRCQITFLRSPRSTLHTLKELHLMETFPGLSRDLDKMKQASYAAQLTSRSTEEDTPIEAIYPLMLGFLKSLDQASQAELLTVLQYEFGLLQILGLEPQWRHDRLSRGAREVLAVWADESNRLDSLSETEAPSIRLELFKYLGRFMAYHLGLPPKLRAELVESTAPGS